MSGKRTSRSLYERALTSFGVALVLAGLGFLGYVAWQYWGTNILADRAQANVSTQLEQKWDDGLNGDAIGFLRVPRFGKDYKVPINRTFSADSLSSGVGWWEKGAMPGQIGNFAIAGHRVTHGEPFKDFPNLRKGDLVEIETRTNFYTYKLRDNGTDRTVDFSVLWVLMSNPIDRNFHPTKPILTMLTCSELFHTRNRSVVFGDLISTVSKTSKSTGSSG